MDSLAPKKAPFPARPGFTLIELLTVIAIIGILAAILIPVTAKVRSSAKATECTSNLRQLASAMMVFAGENRGRLPTSYNPANQGQWWHLIYPYTNYKNPASWSTSLSTSGPYKCPEADPTDPTYIVAWVSYKMNSRLQNPPSGAPAPLVAHSLAQIERPSATLLIGEGRNHSAFWTWDPANRDLGFWYPHGSKANAVFVDGHVVRWLPSEFQSKWTTVYNP